MRFRKVNLFVFILFSFVLSFAGAREKLSEPAEKLIEDFFELRMNVSRFTEKEDILSEIDSFSVVREKEISALDEEEQLVLENFVVMERYNYLYQIPSEKKVQQSALGEQRLKCETFAKGKDDLSPWFYVTYGDVTSCYMGFSPSDVLKYGTSVRPLYEKALGLRPDLSYVLTNIAQWYMFAPGIAGGSKKKALSYFEKAYSCADTKPLKYYSCIFLSQLLFENKKFDRASQLMNEAVEIFPESNYLKLVLKANSEGISLYQYNKNNSQYKDKSF